MKKTIRVLASLLVLAAMLVSMPITALAIADNPAGNTVESVATGDEMYENSGTVTTNNGTVETNNGTVTTNNGMVDTNSGTVETNGEDGTVVDNSGTVDTNNGTVGTNKGTVETNDEEGTVSANHGTVTTNNGTVETNGDGDGNGDGVGDSLNGTVITNNGEIITNNYYVVTNGKDGTIDTNNCMVGDFFEFLGATVEIEDKADIGKITLETGNFGTITDNNGTIVCNGEGGFVENNGIRTTDEEGNQVELPGLLLVNKGTLNNNNCGDTWFNFGIVKTNSYEVMENFGTIETNKEYVWQNHGTVETNNGMVGNNYDTIENNNGAVLWNVGTVETNTIEGIVSAGTDAEGKSGRVETNYGTVIADDIFTYGVEVKNTDGGLGTKLIQAVKSTVLELSKLFTRDGYELVGYTQQYQLNEDPWKFEENPIEVSSAEYEAVSPNLLTLIWRAVVKPAEDTEAPAKPVKAPVYPTTVQPEEIKTGTIVRAKDQKFKILEAEDGAILVATMGKLSQKDLQDMKAFLAKYFTPEQIAKLLGDPELLSDELVAQFFGGQGEHIFFRASADLFAKF